MDGSVVGIMLVSLFFSPTPAATTKNIVNLHDRLIKNYKIEEIIYDSRHILPVRWIDVDLSSQRLSAMEGNKVAFSFPVSTGKAATPTVKGKYLINAKHRYFTMRGPDYVVPKVPHTMYFYLGYAIHGAYWHNNFGTPMSHGCVNVPMHLSGKIYKWASVGTLVYVHD